MVTYYESIRAFVPKIWVLFGSPLFPIRNPAHFPLVTSIDRHCPFLTDCDYGELILPPPGRLPSTLAFFFLISTFS